jgi:hypothetical protein
VPQRRGSHRALGKAAVRSLQCRVPDGRISPVPTPAVAVDREASSCKALAAGHTLASGVAMALFRNSGFVSFSRQFRADGVNSLIIC